MYQSQQEPEQHYCRQQESYQQDVCHLEAKQLEFLKFTQNKIPTLVREVYFQASF